MQKAFTEVRQRLICLMRTDPPFRLAPGGPPGSLLDRWLTTRLSPEELQILFRLEELYGESALAELFAEALFEAGVVRSERELH
jgi:hypothetical protein